MHKGKRLDEIATVLDILLAFLTGFFLTQFIYVRRLTDALPKIYSHVTHMSALCMLLKIFMEHKSYSHYSKPR
jgi:hypothetical protein